MFQSGNSKGPAAKRICIINPETALYNCQVAESNGNETTREIITVTFNWILFNQTFPAEDGIDTQFSVFNQGDLYYTGH